MTGNGRKALLVLALSLLPFACSFSRPLPVGSAAPDFTLPALNAPQPQIRLSDINRENPVLLVFWTTWCPNCLSEIPVLKEWQNTKTAKGLRILAVNVEEPRKTVEDFIGKHAVNYPVLLDVEGKTANLYGLSGIPVVLYLEKGGEILYYGFQLPEHIDELLEQRRT